MNKLLRTIGAIIFSIIMYAIPILLTCACIYDWEISLPLGVLGALQIVFIGLWAYHKAEEGET